MRDARPSLARRALALLVLLVVAILAVRLIIGAISAIFWMVALLAVIIAGLWAVATLRAGTRARRERRVESPPRRQVAAAPKEDRVEAEMRKIREQLRQQGRGG